MELAIGFFLVCLVCLIFVGSYALADWYYNRELRRQPPLVKRGKPDDPNFKAPNYFQAYEETLKLRKLHSRKH